MLCLGCRDNRCVGDQREVDARIWDEVGLKFSKIDVEGTVEAEGCSDGGNNCDDMSASSKVQD